MSDSTTSDLCTAIQKEIRTFLEQDSAVAGLTQAPGASLVDKARHVVGLSSDQLPEVTLEQTNPYSWRLRIAVGVFVRSADPVPSTLDRLNAEITTRATHIVGEADSQRQLDTTITLVTVSVVS